MRAVKTARHDYTVLAEAAGLYSAHLWDVPQQVRKAQDEARAARRAREELLDEVAEHQAAAMLSAARVENGRKVLSRVFSDRDLAFIKLLAQKITRLEPAVALLASTSGQAAVVFAQSSGQPFHMGSLMKEALGVTGGRGGGSQDMAQGGPENTEQLESILQELSRKVR
jgi:alanyl-tRNA synthetase